MLRLNKKQDILRKVNKLCEEKTKASELLQIKIVNPVILEKIYFSFRQLDAKLKKAGKVRNICFFSSRARANYRYFKLSRIFIRELGNAGFFMGMRKTSF